MIRVMLLLCYYLFDEWIVDANASIRWSEKNRESVGVTTGTELHTHVHELTLHATCTSVYMTCIHICKLCIQTYTGRIAPRLMHIHLYLDSHRAHKLAAKHCNTDRIENRYNCI